MYMHSSNFSLINELYNRRNVKIQSLIKWHKKKSCFKRNLEKFFDVFRGISIFTIFENKIISALQFVTTM